MVHKLTDSCKKRKEKKKKRKEELLLFTELKSMLLHLHFIHEEKKKFAHILLFIEPVLPFGPVSPLSPSSHRFVGRRHL